MKKTVEEKAELAKLKIDKKLQKQQQRAEKAAAKKEEVAAKKEARKEIAQQKRTAKKEAAEKIKALKQDAKQNAVKKAKEKPAKKPEKKPAKGKNKKEKAAGGSKKKLLIGAVALVFLGGGVGGFLWIRNNGDKEEEKYPLVEAYVLDDDVVTSIPEFLGESEERALPEITTVEDGENVSIEYDYTEVADAAEEVKEYVTELTTNEDFVPMFDYSLEAPGGYISIAKASTEEGKIFKMDIDYTDDDYKIIISKSEEALPEKKEPEEEEEPASREGALQYLEEFPVEKLGLARPVGEYMAIYDDGRSKIGGYECYGINLYEIGIAGTNVAAGKFFVPLDQSRVFKYDPLKNEYTEIQDETEEAEAAKEAAAAKAAEESAAESEETDEKADSKEKTKETTKKEKTSKEEKTSEGE